MCNILKQIFELIVFFVLFLVYKIWSIFYSNSEPVTCKKSGKDFCKPDSDANQWGKDLYPKVFRVQRRSSGGDVGGQGAPQKWKI